MANDYKNIELEMKELDTDALHTEIKAQLGDKFFGLSTSGDKLILHVAPDVTGADTSKALLAYAAHDVSKLPPKVTPKSDSERIAELETLVAQLIEGKAKP